jgi:hypothetical protein
MALNTMIFYHNYQTNSIRKASQPQTRLLLPLYHVPWFVPVVQWYRRYRVPPWLERYTTNPLVPLCSAVSEHWIVLARMQEVGSVERGGKAAGLVVALSASYTDVSATCAPAMGTVSTLNINFNSPELFARGASPVSGVGQYREFRQIRSCRWHLIISPFHIPEGVYITIIILVR